MLRLKVYENKRTGQFSVVLPKKLLKKKKPKFLLSKVEF